jgi:hypothetical protein
MTFQCPANSNACGFFRGIFKLVASSRHAATVYWLINIFVFLKVGWSFILECSQVMEKGSFFWVMVLGFAQQNQSTTQSMGHSHSYGRHFCVLCVTLHM